MKKIILYVVICMLFVSLATAAVERETHDRIFDRNDQQDTRFMGWAVYGNQSFNVTLIEKDVGDASTHAVVFDENLIHIGNNTFESGNASINFTIPKGKTYYVMAYSNGANRFIDFQDNPNPPATTNISNGTGTALLWSGADATAGDPSTLAITNNRATSITAIYGETLEDYGDTLNISGFVPENNYIIPVANNATVNINGTVTSAYNDFTARLWRNGTVVQEENITTGTQLIEFVETFEVGNHLIMMETFNNESGENSTTNLLKIATIGIDNCSVYDVVAMNLTLYNETNESVIVGSLAGYLKLWIDDETDFIPFNLTWADWSNFAICINENTSYNAYAQFEYTSTGFATETYYFYNTTLDNNTDFVNLYLTPGTTPVTFTVTDTNDKEIENVYINVLQYDLETNSYQTTEILKTDSNGQAIGNIIQNTQWYQFILNYQGVIVQQTTPTKITNTQRTFRINLDEDYFGNYNIAKGIITSLTFTNATKNFALTWDDPSGDMHYMCLEVIQRSINGDTLVNETCVESTSGNILVNIGTPIDETYIATAWIKFDQPFIMDVLSVGFDYTWKKFGTSGVFVSFLLILGVTMVGLWNPIAAVIMMIAGFIFTNLIGIFHLDWEWLLALIILGGIVAYRLGRKE